MQVRTFCVDFGFGASPRAGMTNVYASKGNYCPRLAVSVYCLPKGESIMTISIAHLQPIVALIAGILILIIPRLLNIIVAVYLILIGLLGLGLR